MTPAIEVKGVSKSFGRTRALDGVDLVVPPGTFLGLIGHNGAGKSTLLELLFGRLSPTSGTVRVCGVEVCAEPAAARAVIGGVPEEAALYEWLTAREWFELVAEVRGHGNVASALAICDLGADAERPIREYSQGMRRRTALAAALLGEPPVVLLDEALNGLDPPSAARIKGILRGVVDTGRTVVLSTHVIETVERVADRVVMLANGRVVADEAMASLGDRGLERLFLERLAASRA